VSHSLFGMEPTKTPSSAASDPGPMSAFLVKPSIDEPRDAGEDQLAALPPHIRERARAHGPEVFGSAT